MNPFAELQDQVEAYRRAGIVEALAEADIQHDAIVESMRLQFEADLREAQGRIAIATTQVTTAIAALGASRTVWAEQEAELEREITRLRGILRTKQMAHGRHRREE